MNDLYECCHKYSLNVKKIEYYDTYILIYTKKQIYLFLDNDLSRKERFSYFKKIDFSYYHEYINCDEDSYGLYLYYNGNLDNYMKAIDALSLLHNKTIKDINYSYEQFEKLYLSIKKKIQDVLDYYENIFNYILSFSFPRIDYYCMIVNISIIFQSIFQAFYYLDKWFNNKCYSLRKCLLLQKTSIDNFCFIDNRSYFYDFRDCKEDLLIYDFVSFYKDNYVRCDMKELFLKYQSIIPYNQEEKTLFFSLISVPEMIKYDSSIYGNILLLNKQLDYINMTNNFISEEDEEYKKTN